MDVERLLLKDSQEWRDWLEVNHASNPGIWLLHYKKNSGKVSVSHDEAVEEALRFGWIDGQLKSIDKDSYILRYSPRKANSVWSKINKDKAEKLIAAGKMTAAGMAKIEEARKNGNWDAAYTNKVKDEMPPDFEKALKNHPQAWENFEQFSNSTRNIYIGWVNNARTEVTRRKRILDVVERSIVKRKPGL